MDHAQRNAPQDKYQRHAQYGFKVVMQTRVEIFEHATLS